MSNAPDSVQDQRPSQSPQRLQSSSSQSNRNVTLDAAAAVSSQPAPGRSNRSSSGGSIPLTQRLKHVFYHVGDRMAQLPFFRPPQPRFNGHGQGQGYGKSHLAADMNELESTYRVLPLIIGCIIPVSILINVPSVTSPWVGVRPYDPTTDSWGDPVEMPLPHWMNAMIIVALLMAVICNVCVLSRFLERHVWHSVVFGLITATLQDILSVGAIVPFCLMYPQSDKYVYLEGFWTMTASMIFSLTATFLMSIDLRRTPDFRLHGSGVTHKQRMLIAHAMALCFYLAFGALVFIWIEKWSFPEALFFVMVTITTIGFGDRVPKSGGGRAFVVIYGAGGIVLFAMAVNAIRYVILEDLHRQFAFRAKERKIKRDIRRRERREEQIREQERKQRIKAALESMRRLESAAMAAGAGAGVSDGETVQKTNHLSILTRHFTMPQTSSIRLPALFMRHSATIAVGEGESETGAGMGATEAAAAAGNLSDSTATTVHRSSSVGNIGIKQKQEEQLVLEMMTLDSYNQEQAHQAQHQQHGADLANAQDSLQHGSITSMDENHINNYDYSTPVSPLYSGHRSLTGRCYHLLRKTYAFAGHACGWKSKQGANIAAPCKTPWEQREADRKLAYEESMEEYGRRLRFNFIIFMSFWLIGAALFKELESWSYGQAVYFSFIAFSSIGYGDVVPLTLPGRSIFLVYCLVGIVTLTSLASLISEVLSKTMRRHVVETQLRRTERFMEQEDRQGQGRRASDTDLEHGDIDGYGRREDDDREEYGDGFASDDGLQAERMQTLHSLISPASLPLAGAGAGGVGDGNNSVGGESNGRTYQGALWNLVQVSRDFDTLLQKVLGLDYVQGEDQDSNRDTLISSWSPTSTTAVGESFVGTTSSAEAQTIMGYLEKEDNDDDSLFLSPSISHDITSTSSIHRQTVASLGRSFSALRAGNTYHGGGSGSNSSSDSKFSITAWPTAKTPPPVAVSGRLSPLEKPVPLHSPHPNAHRLHPNAQWLHPNPTHRPHSSTSTTRPRPASPQQQHQQQQGSGMPVHRHNKDGSVTISALHWKQLIEYSATFRALTDSCNETLKRLLEWEACEKRAREKQQKAKRRQERILRERRRRIFQMGGTYGAIDDEIEDEEELEEEWDEWDEQGSVDDDGEETNRDNRGTSIDFESKDHHSEGSGSTDKDNRAEQDRQREGITDALLGTARPSEPFHQSSYGIHASSKSVKRPSGTVVNKSHRHPPRISTTASLRRAALLLGGATAGADTSAEDSSATAVSVAAGGGSGGGGGGGGGPRRSRSRRRDASADGRSQGTPPPGRRAQRPPLQTIQTDQVLIHQAADKDHDDGELVGQ